MKKSIDAGKLQRYNKSIKNPNNSKNKYGGKKMNNKIENILTVEDREISNFLFLEVEEKWEKDIVYYEEYIKSGKGDIAEASKKMEELRQNLITEYSDLLSEIEEIASGLENPFAMDDYTIIGETEKTEAKLTKSTEELENLFEVDIEERIMVCETVIIEIWGDCDYMYGEEWRKHCRNAFALEENVQAEISLLRRFIAGEDIPESELNKFGYTMIDSSSDGEEPEEV